MLSSKANKVTGRRQKDKIILQDHQWWEHLWRNCFHKMQGGLVKSLVGVCVGIFLSVIYYFDRQPMEMMKKTEESVKKELTRLNMRRMEKGCNKIWCFCYCTLNHVRDHITNWSVIEEASAEAEMIIKPMGTHIRSIGYWSKEKPIILPGTQARIYSRMSEL